GIQPPFCPAQKCRILHQFVFQNFRLLGGALPIAGFCSFSESWQFEMRVSGPRAIDRLLEPRPSGNSLRIAPIALDLHEILIHTQSNGGIEAPASDCKRDAVIQLVSRSM